MTKEIVFNKLKEKNGEPISGEELAGLCNVSRAAIWKAINSLRQEGFKIDGTPKGGYALSINSETFSKNIFSSYLKEHFSNQEFGQVIFFKEIDSTNDYAKKLILSSSSISEVDKTVIVSDCQTKGRGRFGRTFVSPPGTGLYLSIILSEKKMDMAPVWLSVYSAVAICRTLKKIYGIDVKIKWINDIYFDNKKICGILAEGFTNFESGMIESAVIGFGLNIVENSVIKDAVTDRPVGAIFGDAKNNKFNRCELAAEICGTIFEILNEKSEDVLNEYKSNSFLFGQTVIVKDLTEKNLDYEATVIDINNQAHLVVKKSNGETVELFSGEVSIKV